MSIVKSHFFIKKEEIIKEPIKPKEEPIEKKEEQEEEDIELL